MNLGETFNDPSLAPDGVKFRSLTHPDVVFERWPGGTAGHEYTLTIDGQPTVTPRIRTTWAVEFYAPFRLEPNEGNPNPN